MSKTARKMQTQRPGLSRGDTIELIDGVVREALREQARDLEKHLIDIHNRLLELESR